MCLIPLPKQGKQRLNLNRKNSVERHGRLMLFCSNVEQVQNLGERHGHQGEEGTTK